MPLDACRTCSEWIGVVEGDVPLVECTGPEVDARATDRDGEKTPIGTMLARGILVVEASTPAGDAVALLDRGLARTITVVDEDERVVGTFDDSVLARSIAVPPSERTLERMMASGPTVSETTPIRAALRILAASHLREVTVIARDGTPLGVFRDVDGLRWVGRGRR